MQCGRDRTGLIAALLLGNAGVAPADIADDYARSVRAMAGTASHAPVHDRQATWDDDQASAWIDEVQPITLSFAADVERNLDRLHLGQDVRSRLRALLIG